jgi:hypothetical protein
MRIGLFVSSLAIPWLPERPGSRRLAARNRGPDPELAIDGTVLRGGPSSLCRMPLLARADNWELY